MERFAAGLLFTFFLWWCAENLPVPRTLAHRCAGSRLAPAQLVSMSCADVVFSNGALLSVCGEESITLVIAQVIFGFPWDPVGQELNYV